MTSLRFLLTLVAFGATMATAPATVSLAPVFGTNMVLQRGKAIPVAGAAAANKTVSVSFNAQLKTTTSDAAGNWQLTLDAMAANATGATFSATESGANTVTLSNVVVGDVWICSGQSNMAFGLGGCNRQTDIDSANFPVLRQFGAPLVTSDVPLRTIAGGWTVCSPSTASGFSAVAFYFGRKICQDQGSTIPIGLFVSSVGGTRIDPWLAPEGAADIPVLAPLYSQSILPWGPFALFNGMVYPYSPLPAKGLVWYQGENSETTTQSVDSYFLKMKALSQGYKRMLGMDGFAFYFVQLANWGTLPADATPVLTSGGWDADTRIQQANAMALPHAGMASALDIGDSADMHPLDKLDLGERLALWALKNDYGRAITETSGPILKDVTISGSTLVCAFDHIGSGLMVGSKTPYLPTAEVVGGTLQKFSVAAASGAWYAASATLVGDTVVVSSPSVATPRRVAYACWQNPVGCNLYNKDGLPASPFYVDDVNAKYTVTASAAAGGSISPAGATTYLKRKTALYTITPEAGKCILDVKVDGVSVGSAKYYTFDPLYAAHTIAATFDTIAPTYIFTTTSTASGTISPAGPVSVVQAGSQTFRMVPNSGCRLIATSVDGAPLGNRTRVDFGDVRSAHAVNATFAVIPTPGAGSGLRGDYFIGTNFETFKLTRTDANVSFDWGIGSPDAAIPVEGFTVRWSGQIQPQFSETYKFFVNHDNGAKLWVNNQLLVDNWTGPGTDDAGSISLVAGTKYDIKLEYVETTGNASCKMEWYSASLPREVVPQSQLFAATTPIYTLSSSAGANGSFSPSGAVLANSGGSQTFSVTPAVGYYVADVKVDNVSVGAPTSYTFSNVIANHTIAATFAAMPNYKVSGKVTNQLTSAAIAGAKVNFYTSAGLIGTASYTATTTASGDYSISIPMGTWCMNATATNYFTSASQYLTVSNAAAGNINFALADGTRNIPRTADLLFSVVSDSLPTSGSISGWPTYQPSGQTLAVIGTPVVESILGRKWEKNLYADGDGLRLGNSYSSAIACTGASIVLAAKPMRSADSGNWRSLVDIFYDRLVLGLTNDGGKVCVRRNGSVDISNTAIPDGQVTILTLIVQPDGSYSVFANGSATAILSGAATGANSFVALVPGVAGGAGGYGSYINIGRNNPDGWSVSNGYIGDVFVYKTALSAAERQTLETDMLSKYISGGASNFTINATAGAGGSISPAGSTAVTAGTSKAFSISADPGYAIAGVTVDGASVGAVASYTFTNVAANHTIAATFTATSPTTYTISASAGTGGSISPSGAVVVNAGDSPSFTITPNSGYTISSVTVDGAGVGALSSYAFTGVAANHSIAAAFAVTANTPPTISNVSDQNLTMNSASAVLAFTVGAGETAASALTVTAVSTNTTLVPNAGVVLGGSGASRTVQVIPAANQSGTTTITLTVSDGTLSTPSSFVVAVAAAGAAKVVSINVGYNGALAAGDSAGVIPVAHWNELSGTNNPTSSALVDESGLAVSGMTASFQGSGNTFNWTGTAGQTMLSGFLTGNPMAVNLANIPYATYDVYIYYAGFGSNYSLTWQATNTATSSVLGTQYSVRGAKSSAQLFADSGWVQSQYATLALADAAAAGNGGNWLKFSGLTAANLRIAETSANGNDENGFAGIQIVKALAMPTLAVTNSPVTYNGSARTATLTGSVAGTASNVRYAGSASVPTAAGTYPITADFVPTDTASYSSLSAAAAGDLVIQKAALTVTATGPGKPYGVALSAGTSTLNFTATAAAAGEAVSSVSLTPDAIGLSTSAAAGSTYVVTPSLATGSGGFLESNYQVTYIPFSGSVAKAAATINLTGLNATFDGTPKAASATTVPIGLSVSYTYNGSATLPVSAGSYTVVATLAELNYVGSASGTLVIVDGFGSWQASHFTSAELAAGLGAPGADPDGDGRSNLAEFAFNGDPRNPAASGLFFTRLSDADGDLAPELTLTCAVRRGAVFAADANHAQVSQLIDGVVYTIEGNSSLTGTWNSAVSFQGASDTAPAGSGLPDLTASAWHYCTFSGFTSLPANGFLRAAVVKP